MKNLLLLLPLIILLAACGGSTPSKATPVSSHISATMGTPVSRVLPVQINLINIQRSNGTAVDHPGQGNDYIIFSVTITNRLPTFYGAQSYRFSLTDTQNTYEPVVAKTVAPEFDTKVNSGATYSGLIVYEVPKAHSAFTLTYTGTQGDPGEIAWAINAHA